MTAVVSKTLPRTGFLLVPMSKVSRSATLSDPDNRVATQTRNRDPAMVKPALRSRSPSVRRSTRPVTSVPDACGRLFVTMSTTARAGSSRPESAYPVIPMPRRRSGKRARTRLKAIAPAMKKISSSSHFSASLRRNSRNR